MGHREADAVRHHSPQRELRALRRIKLLHTLVWAWFAGCVLALPIAAWRGALATAWLLVAIVLVEVVVLAFNDGRCPLTAVAARHTADDAPNFDIYLPRWLARYNKQLFGALYVVGVILTVFLTAWRQS
jgi:Kef-type K+ transport system membrane component KefB